MTVPPLAVGTDYGRAYISPVTGESVPSVTTILDVINKPAILNWSVKMAAQFCVDNWVELGAMSATEKLIAIREAPEKYTMEKASLGTKVHEIADSWAKGVPSENPEKTGPYITQFLNFLMDRRPKFLHTETTFWSRAHSYAGTADAVAEINNEIYLIDFKTGRGTYADHGLQLSALRNADFIIEPDGTELPMPRIDHSAVLHLRPRGYKLIPVYEDEACFTAFLAARQILKWQMDTAEHVLGDPL